MNILYLKISICFWLFHLWWNYFPFPLLYWGLWWYVACIEVGVCIIRCAGVPYLTTVVVVPRWLGRLVCTPRRMAVAYRHMPKCFFFFLFQTFGLTDTAVVKYRKDDKLSRTNFKIVRLISALLSRYFSVIRSSPTSSVVIVSMLGDVLMQLIYYIPFNSFLLLQDNINKFAKTRKVFLLWHEWFGILATFSRLISDVCGF